MSHKVGPNSSSYYYHHTCNHSLSYRLLHIPFKLNCIIRSSIRTIFSIHRLDHSITDSHQLHPTSSLKKHSLIHPIPLAHKAIYYNYPPSLTSLLTLRRLLNSLRANYYISLIFPHISYLKYHKRAFSFIIPSLWNSLPVSIISIYAHLSFITHIINVLYSLILIIQHYYFYKLYYFIVLFISFIYFILLFVVLDLYCYMHLRGVVTIMISVNTSYHYIYYNSIRVLLIIIKNKIYYNYE